MEMLETIGKDDLKQILDLLVPSIKPRVEDLQRYLIIEDFNKIKETAHALAGAAYLYGLVAIGNEAKIVEDNVLHDSFSMLRFSIKRIATILEPSFGLIQVWCLKNL